jgi:hypothetical protein
VDLDGAVGIENHYGLDSLGDRIPMEAKFAAPFQTGPGAHPASYTVGTGSLCRGGKRPGRDVSLPPHETVCSETSAYKIQTLGNYTEENIQQVCNT